MTALDYDQLLYILPFDNRGRLNSSTGSRETRGLRFGT